MTKKIKLTKDQTTVLRQIIRLKSTPTEIFTRTGNKLLSTNIKLALNDLEKSKLIQLTGKNVGGQDNPIYEPTEAAKMAIKKLQNDSLESMELDIEEKEQ